MSTSLAEQLRRLAVPQTSALIRDKKRASLLFDPKEAASLKRETVYQIGLEGLEELIAKNPVFAQFKSSLFHISGRDYERSVDDKKANEKLNRALKQFLLLLNPYFLLNCTHKALEWCVNRYAIHEYNRQELLMLIMPYHESNIFVRAVQLLKFRDVNDSWYFLKSLQKPGVHLPKQSLLNHAASNSGFLKFVSTFITDLIKVHKNHSLLTVAFNFYCTVYTGAIEYSDEVNEDQVSQMLSLLLNGLNSHIADFCAASYVIVARLVVKSTFSNKLLDRFVEKVADVKIPGLRTEAILVLVVLYQSQEQYVSIPAAAVESLVQCDWIPTVLQDLDNAGSFVYPFLVKFFTSCIEFAVKEDSSIAQEFAKNLLDHFKFEDSYVSDILTAILHQKFRGSEQVKNFLSEALEMIERQYPSQFDKEIYSILNTTDKNNKKKNLLIKILKNSQVYKEKFNMFGNLYNTNSLLRKQAVKYFKQNYNELSEKDKNFIQTSFLDRLHDEDASVVQETLAVLSKTKIIDDELFKNTLIKLADRWKKSQSNKLAFEILQKLSDYSAAAPNDWKVFLAFFPYLMPESDPSRDLTIKILSNLQFTKQNRFLASIQRQGSSQELVENILASLKTNKKLETITEFIDTMKTVPNEERSALFKYQSALILSHLLPTNSSINICSLVLEILKTDYDTVSEKTEGGDLCDIVGSIQKAASDKFPLNGFVQCLFTIIEKTQKLEVDLGTFDFSLNSPIGFYFVTLTNVLCTNMFENNFRTLLEKFFKDFESTCEFLLNLCCSGQIRTMFVMNCLQFMRKDIILNQSLTEGFIDLKSLIVPYFLINLYTPTTDVRQIIFEILQILLKTKPNKNHSYLALLLDLFNHKAEIMQDFEQLPLVLARFLGANANKAYKDSLLKICCAKSQIYVQSGILRLLSQMSDVDVFEQTSKIAIDILEDKPESLTGFHASVFTSTANRIDANLPKALKMQSNIWKFIKLSLANDKLEVFVDENTKLAPAVLILNQIFRDFFDGVKATEAEALLDLIIESSTLATNPEVLPSASRIFKHIDLDAKLILKLLTKMRDVQSPKLDPKKKKRRVSVVPTIDILDTLEWRKGLTTLEFIQDKKKFRNVSSILPVLFEILKKCLDFDEQAAVEYPKQLILSLVLLFCTKSTEKLPGNLFEMPLIVQCIRASQNPQTHHHALLVLAQVATLIPHLVLQHMIPIFTFVGSSILRHDDAYSFQIMIKIIDTVIPILVADNQPSTITKVLRDFVNALLDVPEHKRTPLYTQLLTRINVNENLYIFLLLVLEAHVVHASEDKQQVDKRNLTPRRLDIAANLTRAFPPDIVIVTCIKLVKYLKELPEEKDDKLSHKDDDIFNIANYSAKQFRHYKFTLVTFIANLLSSPEFVNQVARLSDTEILELQDLFKEIIIHVLTFIQRTSKMSNSTQAHFWKAILHHSYDILDSINALLTSQMFLLVIRGLMVHNLAMVRRRALELLNTKLQHNTSFLNDCDKNEIYALVSPITLIIESINEEELSNEQEQIIQIALLSLKLLVKTLASEDPAKFVQILDFITTLIKCGKAQNNVLASAVLCLSELCVKLRAHAIGSLPIFMPAIIKVLKQQNKEELPSVLLLSILTAIQKIFDSLPLFLSPYLEKLLVELSLLMSKYPSQGDDDPKLQPFINKLQNIKAKIGSIIPGRVLIPAIEQCYQRLIEKECFNGVQSLMDILAENLGNLQGNDVNVNMQELTAFFLNALQFRAEQKASVQESNAVERHIIKALTVLILKLSESSFRPLYYKLYDWAAVRTDLKSERLITFYSLSSGIAESLKGLFVLFAGHFLNNAAQILNECNTLKGDQLYFDVEEKNVLLLESVLKTLTSVFQYDNQKFINKDRFEVLMQPLVDQLENTLAGVKALAERNAKLLTPCLVQFATATADDALWKQMNYQILLKMRHDTSEVRLVALHCLTEIVRRLGEDFLPLLPETIPFLAELLEDEDEVVEKACKKAVQEMEKALGEPLQKYF